MISTMRLIVIHQLYQLSLKSQRFVIGIPHALLVNMNKLDRVRAYIRNLGWIEGDAEYQKLFSEAEAALDVLGMKATLELIDELDELF